MFPQTISWYLAGVHLGLAFCVAVGWTVGSIITSRLLSHI